MGAKDKLQMWNNVLTGNSLKINATETERMSTGDTTCQLKLNGEVTRNVDHVKYPRSTISADGTLSKDVHLRALVSHTSW